MTTQRAYGANQHHHHVAFRQAWESRLFFPFCQDYLSIPPFFSSITISRCTSLRLPLFLLAVIFFQCSIQGRRRYGVLLSKLPPEVAVCTFQAEDTQKDKRRRLIKLRLFCYYSGQYSNTEKVILFYFFLSIFYNFFSWNKNCNLLVTFSRKKKTKKKHISSSHNFSWF